MAASPRILVFNDGFSADDLKDLYDEAMEVTYVPGGTRQQLLEMIADYEVYVCSLRIPVDAAVLARARRLRVVATISTGTDHLDLDLLQRLGIEVITIKRDRALLDQITSTAELAFGLLLTCARHLPLCIEATRQGRWERHQLAGRQLRGKVLGIIGVGRLGTMLARYGEAFQMQMLGCDPFVAQLPRGVEAADLPTLLRQSDFISLHVHLTSSTTRLLGAVELAMVKPGAAIINTSRGSLIDEAALIREMESGRIAAAGLDVIDGEWLEDKYNHPLVAYSRRNPRLYITPHVGGTSPEAVQLAARHTFKKVIAFLHERDAQAARARPVDLS